LLRAELLLKQPGIDVHASSKFKATPLHEAAAAGNAPLLQILLKRGAQVQDSTSGFTPLHAACMGSCMRPPAPAAMPAQPAGIQDPVLQDITQHSEPQHEAMQDQQQNPAAPAPTSVAAKPGQLKSAPSKPELAQLLRPKPPASAVPKKMGTALLQRPTPSSRTPATSARTAVTSTRSTAISTGSKVAMPAGTGTAAAGALRASPPPAAAEAAGLRKSQPAAAQVLNRSAPQVQRVSGDVVQLLLGAAPSLLGAQVSHSPV
jgi:ankyrin repeat protein